MAKKRKLPEAFKANQFGKAKPKAKPAAKKKAAKKSSRKSK